MKIYLSIISFMIFTLFVSSCGGEKTYESNASILKRAIKAAENGEWEKAQSLAFKAKKQDPNDPNARVMFALALDQCEDINRAIEEIKVATSLEPSNFMAQYIQGMLLFKNQIYEDCPVPLEKARELQPDNPQTIMLLARTYSQLDNHNEAIKNYVALAKMPQYKNSPEIFNELGVLFFKKKDYKRALKFFNRAYTQNPELPSLNRNIAIFWETLSKLYDDKGKSAKAAANAVKYYTVYENLLSSDSHSEAMRKEILDKIEKLK